MGGKDCANQTCLAQQRLKTDVRHVRSITCPNIHLQKLLEIPCTIVVPMQNPIVHVTTLALGSQLRQGLAKVRGKGSHV